MLFHWWNWGKLRRRATYEVLTSNGSSSSSVTRRFTTIHAFIHADYKYAIITIHGVHTCMDSGILSLDIWPCIFMVILGSNKKSFFVLLGFLWRSKVCHGKYGCFYRHRNLSVRLPQRPSRVGTSFHLFTRNNRQIAQSIDDRDVTKLKKSFFKIQRQTILLVHGFTVTGESMN